MRKKTNIGILGAGAWGTALSFVSVRGGADVVLWSFDGKYKKFSNEKIPDNLKITRDMKMLKSCDVWLITTPAPFFRETMIKAKKFYKNQPVIICTKGLENLTGNFMSEILKSVLPKCKNFGVLSGPQFAAEVANKIPTGSTLAGNKVIQEIGKTVLKQFDINESDDVTGTQICGIGKNAVALICGYNSIVASGENERALILTRAWNEIMKIGFKNGAKMKTFFDFCGIGDLFLSATSATSRNFTAGAAIAKGKKPQGTVEGISALDGLIKRAKKLNISTPILIEMQKKLIKNK